MKQTWRHVLFLHWELDAQDLQKHVPFELDLFEGKAVLSIVPFRMEGIRFPLTPALPFISSLWELNLRTYVNVGGKPGVYFITLDTDSLLAEMIAKKFFHLPYARARIRASVSEKEYAFSSQRKEISLELRARLSGEAKAKSKRDLWATERYRLFTESKGKIFEGEVHHAPWQFESVELLSLEDHFSRLVQDLELKMPIDSSYCRELKVQFSPFRLVGRDRL